MSWDLDADNAIEVVKCPICGEPYKVYPFYAGEQSACPKCRVESKPNIEYEKGE